MLSNDMSCEKREFDVLTVPKIQYGKLLLGELFEPWDVTNINSLSLI